jgi:rare lipoprotein A
MRRVGGEIRTWAAAIAVAALSAAAALTIAHRIAAVEQPAFAPSVADLKEPMQTPNRAAKAAREAFKREAFKRNAFKRDAFEQARLAPDIAGPEPEIVTPIPEEGDDAQEPPVETGRASWYDFDTKTASGEHMDGDALTAAHPTLPFGSKVKIANLDNGRSVVVRINDRGPFSKDRIIDVSRAAAAELGMIGAGVARVSVSLVEQEVASDEVTGAIRARDAKHALRDGR